MIPKPLDVLKKGLSKITQGFKVRRDELNAKLAREESISSSDDSLSYFGKAQNRYNC